MPATDTQMGLEARVELARGTVPGGEVPVRRAVGVLVSRFPLLTETFILREIGELERQGQPVVLIPLLREGPQVVHRKARDWVERALYTPFLSGPILRANLRTLARKPGSYLSVLWRVTWGNLLSPSFLLKTLVLFPKAVYLAERLEGEGVGHLHAHFATHPASVAYIVSALAPITYSLTVHAHDLFVRRTFLEPKLEGAVFVRCISEFNRRFLEERYPEATLGKLRVIHMGIDPRNYGAGEGEEGDAARISEGIESPAPPRILSIAALKPYKGIPVLLEACRLLRAGGMEFRCEIVGDGPMRRSLEGRIRRLGLEGVVSLPGPRPQEEIPHLLRGASLFVLPSVVAPDGQMEGIPVALMEAMASRVPIVASRLSGIPELVEEGTGGLLVSPGDAGALAAAMGSLLRDRERARRLGEAGRRKVEAEFRLDREVAALIAEFQRHNPALPREITGVLKALLPGAAGGSALGVRRVHQRQDSTVVEALMGGAGGPQEAVVKIHRSRPGESAPAPRRARREFEVLKTLHHAFAREQGTEKLGVPAPLALLEEQSLVVMEPCRGKPLDRLIRKARRGWSGEKASLFQTLNRAGLWLHRFQEFTREPGDPRDLVETLAARAQTDLAAGQGWLPGRRATIWRQRLEEATSQTLETPLAVVGQHGDFWPGNVYVAANSLEVIDFEGFRPGLPYEDLATFLLHLELFFSYPGLRWRRPDLRRAFVTGYLQDRPMNVPLMRLCWLAKGLQLLVTLGTGDRGFQGRRWWWQRKALRAALERPPW